MRVLNGWFVLAAVFSLVSAQEPNAGMIMQLHRRPQHHDLHSERYMRRLNTEEQAPEVVPLHLGLGTHYTWVYAGTPPQRASVIIDTGSALTAFPCSGCEGCGNHTDQPFVTTNSSTLVHVTCAHNSVFQCSECKALTNTCRFSQSYLEGSTWQATVVEDIVYLGGDASFDDVHRRNQYGTHFQFGCQSAETGLFVTQVADGIMGLSNTDTHIVAKLYHENKIAHNLFSLCFTATGGTMAIGQPLRSAHRGPIEYVKSWADQSTTHFYNVHLKDVRIGNVSIHAKDEAYTRGRYIIDSGTTDSYLPRTMKTEFMKAFQAVSGRTYEVGDKCQSYTNTDLASLPTIQLVLEAYDDEAADVVLNVPPEHYLVETNGAYCSNLYLSENSGGVIGASLMMNRDVIFDLGYQRIGFVDADCAYDGAASPALPSIHKSINKSASTRVPSETKETEAKAMPLIVPMASLSPAATSVPPTRSTPRETVKPSVNEATTGTPSAASLLTPTLTPSIEPVSDMTTSRSFMGTATPTQPLSTPSSPSPRDVKVETKASGTHPLVLTVVGAILVVGFLLMMLISVSRRRQKGGTEQLWSRVQGDDRDEDEDDEEEFGLVRPDQKHLTATKHPGVCQEDDSSQSSSDDDEAASKFR